MQLTRIHHVAIICADYARSKHFYTQVLGLRVLAEVYREARDSWKLDLALPDGGQIELFSFPSPPPRPSYPEAQGLRHLAFEVADVVAAASELEAQGIAVEAGAHRRVHRPALHLLRRPGRPADRAVRSGVTGDGG